MTPRIAGLFVYPVKGCRGIALERAEVGPMGLAGDRRWMIVDAAGRFLTQREHPALARIVTAWDGDRLTLTLPDGQSVRAQASGGGRLEVRIWRSALPALAPCPEADRLLSGFVGREARLVSLAPDARRQANPDYAGPGIRIAFPDGYPVLVTNTASLAALNEASEGPPLPMDRFRPNVVIETDTPWAECGWGTVALGTARLDLVKPCDRCIVTTTDQARGVRTGDEPIATLRRLRRSADPRIKGVLFGENAVPRKAGTVVVGDPVTVLADRDPWPVHPA